MDTEAADAGQEPAPSGWRWTAAREQAARGSYYDQTPVARGAWDATPAIGGAGSLLSYPPGLSRCDGNLLRAPQGFGEHGSAPGSTHWSLLPGPPASGGDRSAQRPTQGRETQETSQILVFANETTARLYVEDHARAPTSSGDGSAPRQPAIGGDGNRVLSTMEEFARLSVIPSWAAFNTAVKQKLKGRARHALSFHTTTPCQPQKTPGTGTSLKDCGLPHKAPQSPWTAPQTAIGVLGYEINVTIPNSFEDGDGLQLQYHKVHHQSYEKAVQQTCVDLLCFLLVSGPEKVLMHENCFQKGLEDIREIRKLAEQVKQDNLRRCHSESVQPLADRVQHPRPRENPAPGVRPPGPSSNDEFSLQDKLEIFDHLNPMVEYTPTSKKLPGVRRFPPTVTAELQATLKKGTLLSFLEAHPNLFRVTYTGEKSAKGKPQFTFAVLMAQPSMHAPPAIGGASGFSLNSLE